MTGVECDHWGGCLMSALSVEDCVKIVATSPGRENVNWRWVCLAWAADAPSRGVLISLDF